MKVPWAKTAVPHVPPRHVPRPRLLAMLDAATPGQLVLVSAPAGYGKTLLLAEWAALRPERVAWVSLDDDDGTEHRFWSAVLAALLGCAAVPDGSALHRLAASGAPHTYPDFLPHLLAALDELPEPVTLVLDDVHELVVSEPVRALAALVHERSPALQLVLSGRTDPPVPTARLRVAGELCEVRARDLAFSVAEAGALLAGADVEMVAEQMRLLVGETEGWAAGLRLAALSLREAPDQARVLADLVGSSTAISDYLVGEILSLLPPDVCVMLRDVSVCDPLTAGLAAAVSARADAGDVLAALEQETSLVLSSGEGRIWYRVHPLLRAHLRADLQRRHPELIDRLHGRAADWFADHDQPVAAVVHARHAGDVARVTALLERHAVALIAMGEHVAVRDAIGFLVAHGAGADPLVATVAALIAVETGEAADAGEHLARAARSWPGEPTPALVALHSLVRSRVAGTGGDPDRMARAVAELEAVGSWSDPDLVALGRLDVAIERSTVDRSDEARRLAEEVLAGARHRDHGYLAARALAVLAAVAGADGDYRSMGEWAARADAELSRGGWRATAAAALAGIAGAYAALLDARPLRCLDLLGPPGPGGPSVDALDPVRLALRATALVDLGHVDLAVPELRRAQAAMLAGPLPGERGRACGAPRARRRDRRRATTTSPRRRCAWRRTSWVPLPRSGSCVLAAGVAGGARPVGGGRVGVSSGGGGSGGGRTGSCPRRLRSRRRGVDRDRRPCPGVRPGARHRPAAPGAPGADPCAPGRGGERRPATRARRGSRGRRPARPPARQLRHRRRRRGPGARVPRCTPSRRRGAHRPGTRCPRPAGDAAVAARHRGRARHRAQHGEDARAGDLHQARRDLATRGGGGRSSSWLTGHRATVIRRGPPRGCRGSG